MLKILLTWTNENMENQVWKVNTVAVPHFEGAWRELTVYKTLLC